MGETRNVDMRLVDVLHVLHAFKMYACEDV
jgi:hypothetical protein